MFYLALQIAFLLTIAVATGLGMGWWLRSKMAQSPAPGKELPGENNPFDARLRLEQCHRDNATLRRELKEAEERAEKFNLRMENISQHDSDVLERLETYEIRVQALMEDLQMRDDTIAVLEQELEETRQRTNNA